MENKSFGTHERIRKRKDYVTIYAQGVRSYSRHFTVIARQNYEECSRLGITVNKKAGNAVQRNRIKRLLREFFRLNKSRFSSFRDIVIIAKKDSHLLTYEDVCRELESLLIRKSDD
jgi:ribonuclease P protein component